jgi:hypothetical protein
VNVGLGKVSEYFPITGKHLIHQESSDRGIRFDQFAAAHKTVIGSDLFLHENVRKVTWKSPDGEKYYQTEHVLINNTHTSDVIGVR